MKLKRLKINKYRNVKPGTELVFNDKMNILLGKNGTGKTTLLNLIVKLLGQRKLEGEKDVFEIELAISNETYSLETAIIYLKKDQLSAGEEFDLLKLGAEPTFEINSKTIFQRKKDALSSINISQIGHEFNVDVDSNHKRSFELPWQMPLSKTIPFVLVNELNSELIHLFNTGHSLCRLDESLHFFDTITGSESSPEYAYAIPTIITNFGTIGDQPFDSHRNVPNDMNNSELYSAHGHELVYNKNPLFFSKFQTLAGFDSVTLSLPFKGGDNKTAQYTGLSFFCKLLKGTQIRHPDLSYGQRRLLSFLFYSAINKHMIVADELVNGLHHEWIDACVKEIGDRQAFLTTQSSLLLDTLEFSSVEDVRSTFILCELDKDGNFDWRNISKELAEEFYSAYQVGFSHVSEILRTRNMW